MHEVSQFIDYEGQSTPTPKETPINVQTRFTLQELQKIVHAKEKQLFQRAWLPCDAILAEADKATKRDTLHVTLLRIADNNQYKWSVALCDREGNIKPIFAKKFTVKDGKSYYLSTGSLPDEVLQCEINTQGVLSIKSLFCDVNFIVHTNIETIVKNAQCLQSIYFYSNKKVTVSEKCIAKLDVIAYSDIELLDGAKLQVGRNAALLTIQKCNISQGEISVGGVLKIYAANELSYDLTKMQATRMIDITLQNASQMKFVNNYKHNLTYAVLSEEKTSFTLLESIKMQQGLFILAPHVKFTCGLETSDQVILVAQKTYMHIDVLALDKAVLHADFLGVRCKNATVGKVYSDLVDGLYKTSQSSISVNKALVMSSLVILNAHGGSILMHGGSPYIDSTAVTFLDGKFISTAINSPAFMATQILMLDIKTEEVDCSEQKFVTDVNNDGYKLIKSIKIRSTPSYFNTNHSYLYLPVDAAIINKSGNFKAKLAGHLPTTTKFETYNKYAVVKYETKQEKVGKRKWSKIKTGNKYETKTSTIAQPDQTHSPVIYAGTTLIEGVGDLLVGTESSEALVSGNVLAPLRDLIVSGHLQVGSKSVDFDASSLVAKPVAQLSNTLYSADLLYKVDPAAIKYLYKPIVPILNLGATHSEILVLKDGGLTLESTPDMLLELTPAQEVSLIPNLFLSKYHQMNLMGLTLNDLELREWLLNNSRLFYDEATKVDGKIQLAELANLARPTVYYVPYTITLPDSTTKTVLRLQPHLPNFMVNERCLTNMGVVIARSAKLTGSCTVTGLLKIEKNLDLEMQSALTVQRFIYQATLKAVEVERIGKETRTAAKDLIYKTAQLGGEVEVGGKVEGHVEAFINKGAKWSVGVYVDVLSRTTSTNEPVEEQTYKQSTSTGYDGRKKASRTEYLAQRSGLPTTFNVAGHIKIETLVGDIIDKSTVFNSLDTPELITLRGSLIKEVIKYVNDEAKEYSQEKAKNWIGRNLSKKKVLHTLAVTFGSAAYLLTATGNPTYIAVAVVLSGVAIAAEHEVIKDAKKKANRESNAAAAKISGEHSASIKHLNAIQKTLLDKAAKDCQDAKSKVTYQLTKSARTTADLQAARPDIDRVHAEISSDYESRVREIRSRTAADIDKATTAYNRALAENTARYNATIEGINSRPGTTVGIGVQANVGTSGADVRGTYTTGYSSRTATAVTAPLFNYNAPSAASYTSAATQPRVPRVVEEEETDEIYSELVQEPEVVTPREETRSYARFSSSAMEEDYFEGMLPEAPVTDEVIVQRSVTEFMRAPENLHPRRTLRSESASLTDAALYLSGHAVGGLRIAASPLELLYNLQAMPAEAITNAVYSYRTTGRLPDYIGSLRTRYQSAIQTYDAFRNMTIESFLSGYIAHYRTGMDESARYASSGNMFMAGFSSGQAQMNVIMDGVGLVGVGYGAARVMPRVLTAVESSVVQGVRITSDVAGRGMTRMFERHLSKRTHTYNPMIHSGSGPVPGVISINHSSKSFKALDNYTPKKGIEFVYDPERKIFAVGTVKKIDGLELQTLSFHQRLAKSINANENTVLGGTFSRTKDGTIKLTEHSGHYGYRWKGNDIARRDMLDLLSVKLKSKIDYTPWAENTNKGLRYGN